MYLQGNELLVSAFITYRFNSSCTMNVSTNYSCYYVTLNIHNSATAVNGTRVYDFFFAQNCLINNISKFGDFLPRYSEWNKKHNIILKCDTDYSDTEKVWPWEHEMFSGAYTLGFGSDHHQFTRWCSIFCPLNRRLFTDINSIFFEVLFNLCQCSAVCFR